MWILTPDFDFGLNLVFGFDFDAGVGCCVWMLMFSPWDSDGGFYFRF